ncbi:uncharacterized protein KY384_000492 [Bacidia gigantensis]|uniref:uncharacterized protein n=1 Tax=Bacidia gigantensis TaxID=2732470 RepID=UPI001D0543CE|nr:uncharacterized protein KY384_000492 [Bacidia gigantensis]KAG8525732.1 hypothetical protein KY384_000492 [Bacidia gigantensis]
MPKGTSKEPEQLPSASKTEDTFNRFYSTFETIFSKLSAPLAFAGLPLNPESDAVGTLDSISQQSTQSKATSTRPKPHTRATASPEYSRLFSPAALRALREDAGTAGLNTTESFYVVPTTGGALPYASILARQTASRHQKQHSRATTAGGVDADLSDEFVDARETPGNSPEISLKQKRVRGSGTGVKTASGKTLEELELENTGLRSICDELSRRLWQFEVSSQMSHGALHQSLRAGINVSPAASNTGDRGMGVARGTVGGVAGEATGGRVDTIYTEARLQKAENEMEDLRLENEKLRRYREKWERLTVKAKARQRRESSMAVDKVEMEDGD